VYVRTRPQLTSRLSPAETSFPRRETLCSVLRLLRFCKLGFLGKKKGFGKGKKTKKICVSWLHQFTCTDIHLTPIHAGIGERKRATHLLRLIFGDTFAATAYFYKKPNANVFIACLLHVASGGRVSVDADTSRLFVRNGNTTAYRVDESELLRLGCTKATLFETLRRTPGADPERRHPNAAPLIVRAPGEVAGDHVLLSPTIFDDAVCPDEFDFDDDLSSAMTTTYGDGGDDCELPNTELDHTAASSFEERSELDDTASELLIVERELEAVGNRIQRLLTRRRSALGDAPGIITGSLEKMREEVRSRRAAAEVERDACVTRVFSLVF
jgi:hypothetical protein